MNIPRPSRLDIHPGTLGLDALAERADQEWYATQKPVGLWQRTELFVDEPDHPAAALTNRQRTKHLRRVRERISGFNDRNIARLSVLAHTADPSHIEERSDLSLDTNEAWRDWLTGGTPAANERLFNILGEHVRQVEDLQQSPVFSETVHKHKRWIKTAVGIGLSKGWLAPAAEEAIQTIDSVPVYAADAYDKTYSQSPATLGYHGDGFISFRSTQALAAVDVKPDPDELLRNTVHLPHEYAHAVISRLTEKAKEGRLLSNAEEEAGAVQFADAVAGSPPDTIRMRTEAGPRTIYPEYMEAHKILLDGSDTQLLLRAYSGGDEEDAALDRSIDSQWGVENLRGQLYRAETTMRKRVRRLKPNEDPVEHIMRSGNLMIHVLRRLSAEPPIARPKAVRRIIRQSLDVMPHLED